jgi:hypothetical protein
MRRIRCDAINKNSFIIPVEGIFTVSIEPPFTNVFEASAQADTAACVCRRRNAD